MDNMHLHVYFGIIILAGVYRSRGETTESLWDAETGRAIFGAIMSVEFPHIFRGVIRFDDQESRPVRRQRDKLAAICTVWDKWVDRLPLLYNPGANVTVDERLVGFRGRLSLPAVQYMPSKPASNTLYKDGKISGREDCKPEAILDFNTTKGVVDNLDKLLSCYSCQRRTLRWPLVIFFNILDVLAYNAFAIWTTINSFNLVSVETSDFINLTSHHI
ncbi:hypothetical protein F2P81_023999 [Scophthalmus maximus]|uniref:PiggyBac transposable element-derived protein domain-containing protein n=1 Tax=Scophthalmus maximus TaxID=52904 RepID=A0A6A4RSU7_SCOMX|nr:hypothetical protein F2P81_023999 [Scophthalmus maximus]